MTTPPQSPRVAHADVALPRISTAATTSIPKPKPKKKKQAKAPNNGGDDEEKGDEEEDEAVKVARRAALAAVLRDDLRTPYLTCQRCNSVTFINVNRVRTGKPPSSSSPRALDEYEQLPVCSGCGTTKYLRAGVVSFQDKIAEEKQRIKEFEQKRVPATHLLLRIARGFLGRLAFRRRKREHELYLWRIRVAATRIQTRVRGMQARRRAVFERCLHVIRTMHASILQFALAARSDRAPVFWYEHAGERQILFWNYREFVRRSGGKPPLFKVESNILEVARRMLLREHALVSRIQARWRGLTTRLVFFEFKRQRGWLRGLQQSPATKIQRVLRAHHARRRSKALQAVRRHPDRLAAYREERARQHERERAAQFRKKLLHKYRVAYHTTASCKMLALERPEDESAASEGDDKELSGAAAATAVAAVDVKHSLRRPRGEEGDGGRAELDKSTRPIQPQQRHPNAAKLLAMKRLVDAKQQRRVRGPRLHILHAEALGAGEQQQQQQHDGQAAASTHIR